MERMSARAEFQPGLRFPARFVKPGWDFQPGLKLRKTSYNRIKISARAEKWAWACSVIVFSAKQDGGLPLFTAILRHRLHGRGFICNRIGFDAVTPSVYTAPSETVAETGSFWKRCEKWSVLKTIRFHLSCKRRNRIYLKMLAYFVKKWPTFHSSFLSQTSKPTLFAVLMWQIRNFNLDNTVTIISLQF